MKKSELFELRKRCGDPDALCGVRDVVFNDGPAKGMRALEMRNGRGMELTVLADRGLDIPYLSYRGVNIGLMNKVGLRSAALYQKEGASGFLKQFYGGMLTTCGLSHAGSPCRDGGEELGLHGPFDNTPAGRVAYETICDGDALKLRVVGEVREAEVFGVNLLLRRELTLDTEENRLHIRDVVENQGFQTAPLMMVYHMNFGYPMLDEGARVYTTSAKVEPRTDFARKGMGNYDVMEAPEVGREEQCYYHLEPRDGEAFAMLHNERLGLAAVIRYDKSVFPLLCEWKCMRAGEYALGLEPTTSGVISRAEARENGMLTYLEPGQTREFNVSLELTEDEEIIEQLKKSAPRA